jgi:hypothetical protein
LLDFGARSARVSEARAAYDQTVANYRQTVLTAFQQVEDELAASRVLAYVGAQRANAAEAANRVEQLTQNQYLAGQIGYRDVITAQKTALSARQSEAQTIVDRQVAAVTLIQAIGGALVLFVAQRRRDAALLIGAWGLGLLLLSALKMVFARARPDLVFRLVEVNNHSFPSGHAMGAMILYPLLGLLLVRNRSIGIWAGLGVAILIGLTRIILGVHWASDVIGGWLLGGAVVLVAAHFSRPSVRGRRSPANH